MLTRCAARNPEDHQTPLAFSAALITFVIGHAPILGATLRAGFTESLVANGLTKPTAMAFAPDGQLFICLQGGQLRVIENGVLLSTPLVTVTVNSSGTIGNIRETIGNIRAPLCRRGPSQSRAQLS